mgnify:CR=1 FL=1|jgi:hypothetical protein
MKKRRSKSEHIRQLFAAGLTPREIVAKTKYSYQLVYIVCRGKVKTKKVLKKADPLENLVREFVKSVQKILK